VIHVKPLAEITEEDWDFTLDVNLKGAFLCCQAAASALTASGRGRIVTISSDAGRRAAPHLLAYSASKFGLVALTQALAAELAPAVTVNSVCPVGVPSTGMGQQMLEWKVEHTRQGPDEVLSGIARSLPLGRNGTAADIADATLFFVSDAASFITGVALDVDGGAALNVIPGAE
jgi:NAD(P)-dependent dehydrogenase (short-subunit alcohol dehydrogenase family)